VWRELGAADQHYKNVCTDLELDNSLRQLSVDVNDLLGFDSTARVGWAPLLAATPTANETQAEDEVCDGEIDNGVDGLHGNQPTQADIQASPQTANDAQAEDGVCSGENGNGSDGSSNGFDNSNVNQPPLAASETSPPTANENQPAPKWGQLWTPEDAVIDGENCNGSEGASNDGFDDCNGFDDSNGFDADDVIQEPTPAEIEIAKKLKKKKQDAARRPLRQERRKKKRDLGKKPKKVLTDAEEIEKKRVQKERKRKYDAGKSEERNEARRKKTAAKAAAKLAQ